MRAALYALSAALGLAVLGGLVASAAPIDTTRIRVIDGDTIAIDGNRPTYRLVSFNAPDSGNRAGCDAERAKAPLATARLKEILATSDLNFERVACSCRPGTEGTKKCNSGRFCGVLKAGGENVGAVLEREGLAVSFLCGPTKCPKLPRPWC